MLTDSNDHLSNDHHHRHHHHHHHYRSHRQQVDSNLSHSHSYHHHRQHIGFDQRQHYHHHHHQSHSYVEYGSSVPHRTAYAGYRRSSSNANNPRSSKYVISGILVMIFSVPVIIFGGLFMTKIISTGMQLAGIALLAVGGTVFIAGILVVLISCCLCNDSQITPVQTPRSPRVAVIGLETPDPAASFYMRPAQPVLPPPYAPKSASPPPYSSPIGDPRGSSPVAGRRTPAAGQNNNRGTAAGSTTRGPQVINVQSRASPVSRSGSPPPRAPSPTRANAPNSRQNATAAAAAQGTAHRSSSPTARQSTSSVRPSVDRSPSPTRNRSSSPPTRSYGAASPASSSSLPSVLRANSTDVRSTPAPSAGLGVASPANRFSSPSPVNASRHLATDNRRPYRS